MLGSGPLANVPFFGVAFLSSILIAIGAGARLADFQKIANMPIPLFAAGVMSAGLVIGSSFLIPRIGISAFFVLVVSGQVLAGLAFGYFGLFGAPVSAMTFGKLLSAALVIPGVYLVTFR